MNLIQSGGTESQKLRICRCCLSKECTKTITKEYCDNGKKEIYEEMLKSVFNIHFQDIYPAQKYICEECISNLRDARTFRDMVLQNDEMYRICIENYHSEIDMNTNTVEGVKLEATPETRLDIFEESDSFDDDEILANLKIENKKEVNLNVAGKRKCTEKLTKSKRTKIKAKIISETESQCILQPDITKLVEYRGSGPILRGNSIKLLEHSTAAIFQWNKSRYRCFICKEPFSNIIELKTHTDLNHTLNDIQKKIISQQNRLVKVEISNLSCKICNLILKDLDHLKEHLFEHNVKVAEHLLVPFKIESKLKCQICSEPFNLFRLLNIHMNKHYQKYVCYICGAGFPNLVFLNLHRTRSHRTIRCSKCNETFLKKADKKQHDVEMHGAKFERKRRFPCPFCTERFFQENFRVVHLVEKHGMEQPQFSCNFCSKVFITRSLLNNHVKVVHMKEKNQECDVCHNFFYTKSDVARHRVTHTGVKKFSCSLCSSLFASKDSLRRHMKRTHCSLLKN